MVTSDPATRLQSPAPDKARAMAVPWTEQEGAHLGPGPTLKTQVPAEIDAGNRTQGTYGRTEGEGKRKARSLSAGNSMIRSTIPTPSTNKIPSPAASSSRRVKLGSLHDRRECLYLDHSCANAGVRRSDSASQWATVAGRRRQIRPAGVTWKETAMLAIITSLPKPPLRVRATIPQANGDERQRMIAASCRFHFGNVSQIRCGGNWGNCV